MAKRQVQRMIDTITRGQQPYSDNSRIYRGTTKCVTMSNGHRTTCVAGRETYDWVHRKLAIRFYVGSIWLDAEELLVWP